MYKVTKLIEFAPGTGDDPRARLLARLAEAARALEVVRSVVNRSLPGNLNGGDLVWHVQYPDRAAYDRSLTGSAWRDVEGLLADASVAGEESVGYEAGPIGVRQPDLSGGIFRVLLLSVLDGTPQAIVERFEAELQAMPRYISSIRNWQLSRVADSSGARPWTHVWEQEYEDVSGLLGPYMRHPYHWGYIDRWFHPESPDQIVDTYLCQCFCRFEKGVIRG